MDFTGRPIKGFVFIEAEGIDMEEDLECWTDLALEYNPKSEIKQKENLE